MVDKNWNEVSWIDWVKHHLEFFGWVDEPAQKMLLKWSQVFNEMNFEPAECIAATNAIVKTKIFKREDHIQLLIQHIRSTRETQRNITPAKTVYEIPCKICNQFGTVSVPLLKFVVNYSWTKKQTCFVSCGCANGLPYRLSSTGKRMMTLTEYEQQNPYWKNQIRMRNEDDQKINNLIIETAPNAHLKLDESTNRILKFYKIGKE